MGLPEYRRNIIFEILFMFLMYMYIQFPIDIYKIWQVNVLLKYSWIFSRVQ